MGEFEAEWSRHPQTAPAELTLHLEAYDGPIEFLLDMVIRQKIDLGRISVIELADQFQEAVERLTDRASIERRADWLVMAARLVGLRARLMFPGADIDRDAAQRQASDESDRLLEMARMRVAASWLADRPQLGADVFARPEEKVPEREGGYVALMEACLFVLEAQPSHSAAMDLEIYAPAQEVFWTVNDALAHFRQAMSASDGPMEMNALCGPAVRAAKTVTRKRAAVAGAFMAGLELAKAAEAGLGHCQVVVPRLHRGVFGSFFTLSFRKRIHSTNRKRLFWRDGMKERKVGNDEDGRWC